MARRQDDADAAVAARYCTCRAVPMSRPRHLAATFACVAFALRCAPPPADVPFDLLAALASAESATETRTIDFASASARGHLGHGFWRDIQRTGSVGAFVWSNGPTSEVVFTLVEPRDLPLELDGRPFDYPGAPAQRVTIEVGGREIETVAFPGPGRRRLLTTLPREALRRGENRLRFVYGRTAAPRDVLAGNRDQRQLGVAWYGLRFGPSQGGRSLEIEAAAGVRATSGGSLFLPIASAVDFFVDVPSGTRLAVDAWGVRAGPDARLMVEIEPENAPARIVATISRTHTPRLVDLGAPGGIARLGLRALPAGGTASRTAPAFVLDRPRLLIPTSRAKTAGEIPAAQPPADDPPGYPNILLYLVDTLRADYLGSYGNPRQVSPHWDTFAQRSLVFEQAFSQSSWTRASVASLMTGLWPRDHGANRRDEALPEAADTLAERLREAGYATGGFVTNPNITAPFGFDQGFERYDYLGEAARAGEVTNAALSWLDSLSDDRPRFLYLHTIDPHAPYDPPASARQRFAPEAGGDLATHSLAVLDELQTGRRSEDTELLRSLRALYDAEIAWNDEAFGALIQALDTRGYRESTVIAVVSDHGEEFREHGNLQHGHSLHRESVHVPLILRIPEGPQGRVSAPVDHLDLFRTLLAIAGVDSGVGGRDLRRVAAQIAPTAAEHSLVSYLHLDGAARASIRQAGWTLIVQLTEEGEPVAPRLYRSATDPGETQEIGDAFPVRRGFLLTMLRQRLFADPALGATPARIDDELREGLRALGYLE